MTDEKEQILCSNIFERIMINDDQMGREVTVPALLIGFPHTSFCEYFHLNRGSQSVCVFMSFVLMYRATFPYFVFMCCLNLKRSADFALRKKCANLDAKFSAKIIKMTRMFCLKGIFNENIQC